MVVAPLKYMTVERRASIKMVNRNPEKASRGLAYFLFTNKSSLFRDVINSSLSEICLSVSFSSMLLMHITAELWGTKRVSAESPARAICYRFTSQADNVYVSSCNNCWCSLITVHLIQE